MTTDRISSWGGDFESIETHRPMMKSKERRIKVVDFEEERQKEPVVIWSWNAMKVYEFSDDGKVHVFKDGKKVEERLDLGNED